MKIPEKHFHFLTFRTDPESVIWYKITAPFTNRDVYHLYKQLSKDDFELLGTSSDPVKLEYKVYEGKFG